MHVTIERHFKALITLFPAILRNLKYLLKKTIFINGLKDIPKCF